MHVAASVNALTGASLSIFLDITVCCRHLRFCLQYPLWLLALQHPGLNNDYTLSTQLEIHRAERYVIKTLQAPGLDAHHTWHSHSQQNTHANNRNLTSTSQKKANSQPGSRPLDAASTRRRRRTRSSILKIPHRLEIRLLRPRRQRQQRR